MRTAIFILSHERPNGVTTYDLLTKGGYDGEIFIFVDDQDKCLDQYKEKFKDKIVVFNKEDEYRKTDCIYYKKKLISAVFARNAILRYAKDNGYEYIAMFDDDATSIAIRYEEEGKLKSKGSFKNGQLTRLINSMFDFMEETRCDVLSWAFSRGMFGGVNGQFKKMLSRTLQTPFFINTTRIERFRGIHDEDLILALDNSTSKNIFGTLTSVQTASPERGTNEGGLKDSYQEDGEFIRDFIALQVFPSAIKLTFDGSQIKQRKNWSKIMPKLLIGGGNVQR